MISSTVWDLPEHREQVRDACLSENVFPIGMEYRPAQDANGIRVSLEMVDQSDVYIGVYAWRYGWVPDFDNPDKISITEMEFNHALQRKESGDLKEVLIFIMDDDHPIIARDKEDGDQPQEKLKKFKARASGKRNARKFRSKEELKTQIIHALAYFKEGRATSAGLARVAPDKASNPIPKPPAFYAEPDYIGSHQFVGRDAELQALSDWAARADPTNLLLFEAIGGNGKSMLTWEWTRKHATTVRTDWAGHFWYSFYEKGAVMADFCRRALAYMTGRSLDELRKKKTAELKEPLLAQLHAKPWLLTLDGLERVLVAYHRIDAAEIPDEEANIPIDKIANRDPCDAIRDEDSDLLRTLAAAAPSKILISSRLTPRVLLNSSGQPITGAKRITLPGLRPPDAEKLLRSCGIEGDSALIQSYLTTNCDNHPLVIGVLGGLISNYLPARGNFDAWVADADGGAKLDLASLDLTQRRNHILRTALDALQPARRQLLSTLALLSESVDYETLKAFNPHQPPEPEEAFEPTPPERRPGWEKLAHEERAEKRKQYEASLARWQDYGKALDAWLASEEYRDAPKKLASTVRDLEQRGLLQYDGRTRRYVIHPVVRGVAVGAMKADEKESYGQRVVDHFSSLAQDPYSEAKTLEDLRYGLNIVRTLLKMGRYQQAFDAYRGDLSLALFSRLEAYAEILSLLRPFFPAGWGTQPLRLEEPDVVILANHAAQALLYTFQLDEAYAVASGAIVCAVNAQDEKGLLKSLQSIANTLSMQNRLVKEDQCRLFAQEVARYLSNAEFRRVSLGRFLQLGKMGRWQDAEASRPTTLKTVTLYALALRHSALLSFWNQELTEQQLADAEKWAKTSKNRVTIRNLQRLRGQWYLESGSWMFAIEALQEAVRMARVSGHADAESETSLALAKYKLDRLAEPRREAERLAQFRDPAHRLLAQLWFALGERAQAEHHALAAYRWAWADGEPYVHRYELTKTTELLQRMNVPIPKLAPYDLAKDEPFPWEANVRAVIEALRGKKAAEKRSEGTAKIKYRRRALGRRDAKSNARNG